MDHAGKSPENGLTIDLVGKPQTRAEVFPMDRAGPDDSIAAGSAAQIRKCPLCARCRGIRRVEIEPSDTSLELLVWHVDVPTQPQVDGQPPGNLPIVLHIR